MSVLTVSLMFFFFIMALAVAALGLVPVRCASTGRATVSEGVAHGIAGIVCFIALWWAVPRFTSLFADFGVELPGFTRLVTQTSNAAILYPYLFIPALVFLLVADIVIFWVLHRDQQTRTVARLFSASTTGFVALGLLVSMLALFVPLTKLHHSLSRSLRPAPAAEYECRGSEQQTASVAFSTSEPSNFGCVRNSLGAISWIRGDFRALPTAISPSGTQSGSAV